MTAALIINADDFGMSHQMNRAILEAFRLGLCSSATLAATMPGFEEACELTREQRLLDHVGVHLMLRDGFPLTEQIKRQPRFCDKEGRLALASTDHPILVLNRSERDALAGEIRAQIRRCRNVGIPLTHLDSHYHLHNHLAVLRVLVPIVRSEGIHYIRTARNCAAGLSLIKRCYKRAVNLKLSSTGLRRTKLFGSVDDFLFLKRTLGRLPGDSFEVMIHPALDQRDVLTDERGGPPLLARVKAIDSHQNAVSFSGKQVCRDFLHTAQDAASRPDRARFPHQNATAKLQPSEIKR